MVNEIREAISVLEKMSLDMANFASRQDQLEANKKMAATNQEKVLKELSEVVHGERRPEREKSVIHLEEELYSPSDLPLRLENSSSRLGNSSTSHPVRQPSLYIHPSQQIQVPSLSISTIPASSVLPTHTSYIQIAQNPLRHPSPFQNQTVLIFVFPSQFSSTPALQFPKPHLQTPFSHVPHTTPLYNQNQSYASYYAQNTQIPQPIYHHAPFISHTHPMTQ
ncbi:hypothetical protein R3W88_019649 [Solanum pinnatisectum]|uniref:FRIGIDA-like protein n=1 Tax=Solanum pinnatisectum TaxID=50273 RepID=A0AAV9KNU1_9SOLN|nr:hypothetical protein R3W88_019649 [Solanum pinnatisectum]